ncbi:YdiU family protein [Mycobacterium sp. M1]|uniref:Protein nucleotidyltransferase YdiU n=1 Tax=Mycolicibacter acidiphilus TaxID=2835306 RepID=A0ABS5RMF4_9MYCO|nr:YdiU family protein [Mycolicibacter acidiphilus]MBS9535485.1 YdiU family protein [Mycolicibacter acidiphilus]
MSAASAGIVTLDSCFARDLPELSVPWQAETPPDPKLLILNEPLAAELGLDAAWLKTADGIGLLTGTNVPAGATPVAQAYAGHQFGNYVPTLGDGRALLLGELEDALGNPRDLHLKGAGRTPFARGGDGLAVVGPMLREYLISEALHALNIPTTRSLAVVATGRDVHRETRLPGAVLTRVAASHLRVGSFQYAAAQARATGDLGLLRRLADHAINRHYPSAEHAKNRYLALFEAVARAQAALVAEWMLVGFIHGVMNTDNTTISGETIDYGPCAFLEAYDPATVYSSIDHAGRYSYGNQPLVAQWNLARFAETLLPLFADDEEQALTAAVNAMEQFLPQYHTEWSLGMRAKFGLSADADALGVAALIDQALALLTENRVDYTSFFRRLAAAGRGDDGPVRALFAESADLLDGWLTQWQARTPDVDGMDRVNPVYIPRNHLVEEALAAATGGDLALLHRLLDVLADPYRERDGLERYAAPAPPEFGARFQTFCGT